MKNNTDLTQRARNDWILNTAYREGERLGLDELEILKRLTITLLDLKDECFQKAVDEAMRSTKPLISIFKPSNIEGDNNATSTH